MALLGLERDGSGAPLVWLHGFTQTAVSARRFRSILTARHELLTLDLPGHGKNAEVVATLNETADLLAAAIPESTFALGGYSFGARVALHVALRHPHRVHQLVLLGASRGLPDVAQREERRESDERWAALIEREGTERFLDAWLAQPLFATLTSDEDERASRSVNAAGLASSLRHAGTGTQDWLGGRLHEITAPTLAMAGALDAKFSLEAVAIANAAASGSYVAIEAAGHAAHLERPELAARAVLAFLD